MPSPEIIYKIEIKATIAYKDHLLILRHQLENLGIPKEHIVELEMGRYHRLLLYFQRRSFAARLIRRIAKFNFKGLSFRLQSLHKHDWQDKWKMDFKPFALSKGLTVVPAWLKSKYKLKRGRPVYIDTSSAFGSGLHETTRFMARLIENTAGKFASFLDIGTGTGILTIVARHHGAKETLSIDVSTDAVKTARSNLAHNGYPNARLKVLNFKNYPDRRKFDMVVANLITHDLIGMSRKIISAVKSGQYLAVSGVSLVNLDLFKKSFVRHPLRCLKIIKGRKWAALLYKKRRES